MEVEFFFPNCFSHHKVPTKMLIKQISITKQKNPKNMWFMLILYSYFYSIWQNYHLVISTYTHVYHYRGKNVPGHQYNLNPFDHVDKYHQAKFILLCPCTLPQLNILFTRINYFWRVKYPRVSALMSEWRLFGSKSTHKTGGSSPIFSPHQIIE